MSDLRKNVEKIRKSIFFDADWYAAKYRDVELLKIDPAEHFCYFGGLLKRAPGPNFNTRFYMKTYADAAEGPGNPLLVHLDAVDANNRPTTEAAWRAEVDALNEQTRQAWYVAPDDESRGEIDISYCIPVSGRVADLQGTLEYNLNANAQFRERVEFLVIELGEPGEVRDWAASRFGDELETGYLRIVSEPDILDSWHFGKAKNAFRPHLRGRVYSSLDGDNFVTAEETRKLLDIMEDNPLGFVMHHFSGQWGDGSSGRVSLPTWIYRSVGYDPQMMPRQFDEMDLILGALKNYPAVPFVGISPTQNALTMSKNASRFLETERMANQQKYVGEYRRRAPLNPRGEDYTNKAPYLRDMNNLNSALSALQRGTTDESHAWAEREVNMHKYKLIESMPESRVLDMLFDIRGARALPKPGPVDICLVACLHDEDAFLFDFVEHYRKLGVSYFLFVDDNSQTPVAELGLGDDVYAYRPKVGGFRTTKTMWMECLLKAAGVSDGWVIAADADEFIQLPDGYESLHDVIAELEAQKRDFAPGILLDMVPDPSRSMEELSQAQTRYGELFNHFLQVPGEPDTTYNDHHSVKWAFGPHAQLSWRADTRYHLFGTFDSLRKFPLYRVRPSRHLNQGFHTFHMTDGTPSPSPDIWTQAPVLPIFHYKLIRLFFDAAREKMLSKAEMYHYRTAGNISQIFSNDPSVPLSHLKRIAPWLRPGHAARQQGLFRSVGPTAVAAEV